VESLDVGHPVRAWLAAFCLTLAIEMPVLAFLGRRAERSLSRRATVALIANAASHPVVWFGFPALGLAWGATTALSELWAWLVEASLYRLALRSATWRLALGLSLAANLLSFGLGLALWALHILA
jgi:hypothetical protein